MVNLQFQLGFSPAPWCACFVYILEFSIFCLILSRSWLVKPQNVTWHSLRGHVTPWSSQPVACHSSCHVTWQHDIPSGASLGTHYEITGLRKSANFNHGPIKEYNENYIGNGWEQSSQERGARTWCTQESFIAQWRAWLLSCQRSWVQHSASALQETVPRRWWILRGKESLKTLWTLKQSKKNKHWTNKTE